VPSRFLATPLLRGLGALGAGALGGLCFRALGLPLPWTLGAMAAAALLTLPRCRPASHRRAGR
jgi:uncharacterized membrane protein AbrB (regulator of aidB expression)